MFGEKHGKNSFDEKSLMVPKSPYGVSKLYSYWITKVYRQAYGFFASNGILFNHESPRRGETFVTRKITRFFAEKILGSKDILYLGNLNAKGIGVTQKIIQKCNGGFCSKKAQMIM